MNRSDIDTLIAYLKEIEERVVSNKRKMDEMSQEILTLKSKLVYSNKLVAKLSSENKVIKSNFLEEIKVSLSKIQKNLKTTQTKNSLVEEE